MIPASSPGVRLSWPGESALVLWRTGDAEEVRAGDFRTQADVAVIRRNAAGEVTGVYTYGATEVGEGG